MHIIRDARADVTARRGRAPQRHDFVLRSPEPLAHAGERDVGGYVNGHRLQLGVSGQVVQPLAANRKHAFLDLLASLRVAGSLEQRAMLAARAA